MDRWVMHVDMDEFFAAVEKLDRPELRGRCLLIGGSPDARGVVSTASYEARRFGCRSAMPMATAVRLCPEAIVLPVRFGRYGELSRQVFEILRSYSPLVEPLSVDEAFIDVTGCEGLWGPPDRLAEGVKRRIAVETGLTASVGVAPNMFLAKLASDLRKPDGLVVIRPDQVHHILDPLPVGRIWGIGPSSADRLAALGIRTIGQLRCAPEGMLRRRFGEVGEHWHRLARGIDNRPVTPDHQAKSISQEQTFAQDVADPGELRRILGEQIDHVAARLRRHGLHARKVHLKLRQGDFTTLSRSATLPTPTDVTAELARRAWSLFDQWRARRFAPLRLLGAGVSDLSRGRGQLPLFESPGRARQQQLDRVVDGIVERFGTGAVRRGASMPAPRPANDGSPDTTHGR